MTLQFAFLKTEWPDLHDAASKAEALAYPDARTACFYARRSEGQTPDSFIKTRMKDAYGNDSEGQTPN